MYWFKPSAISCLIILVFISGLQSCRPDVKDNHVRFFDIKGFFAADSAKLTKLNPLVRKLASHNGHVEIKKLHIKNWGSELSLFTGSDINKPAWEQDYELTETDTLLQYKAKLPELKTRIILVKKQAGKVKEISIYNSTENFLYTNTEKLTYFPDSLYRIQKTQHVVLLGTNYYKIEGLLLR
ncbi:MAG: hypothetical protein EOP54_21650 [Sphingobacteriales bacterium]|nr:MAG: hypothetical protein EOP54_21650 [Sphingobacteriales bacterium]